MKKEYDLNELARKARSGDQQARADLQSHLRPHLERMLRRAGAGSSGGLNDRVRQAAQRLAEGDRFGSRGPASQLARIIADRLTPNRTTVGLRETQVA